jgi:hypothetical protein
VPKRLFRSPADLVKQWPEVFEDLYINTMPVAYLEMLRLEFHNGRIWEIDLQEYAGDLDPNKILEILNEYEAEISKIDFRININKLKVDIEEQTKKLF